MISFDTFTGEAHNLIDEKRDGTYRDDDARRHAQRSRRGSRRRSRRAESEDSVAMTPRSSARAGGSTDDASTDFPVRDAPRNGVQHLFQLLSLKNHTDNAKRALVQRLLGVNNVNELVLSKATEEQIASAANEALSDEILATVDMEDKRRKSVSTSAAGGGADAMSLDAAAAMDGVIGSDDASENSYRVLELVDVLDSTTGGMVRRILTDVRKKTPGSQASNVRKTEFCGFCVDYRTHSTAQHKCRVCGALGQHRSQTCKQAKAPVSSSSSGVTTPRGRRRSGVLMPTTQLPKAASTSSLGSLEHASAGTGSRLTPDAADKSFCTFCSTWGFHSTENHRCRICNVTGEHRSRDCTKKSSGEGYRWRGSPAEQVDRKFCDLCGTFRSHTTEEHRCRICLKLGEHRSKNCPMHTPSDSASPATTQPPIPTSSPSISTRGRMTPRSAGVAVLTDCSFCGKKVSHRSEEHICRVCRATGLHRSGDCPSRKGGNSMLSYSVETASKVRDRVLESIPLVLPSSATTIVMGSIDKVGDVDTILRRTLQKIGVWGGGSQTPITTPYAAPAPPRSARQSFVDAPVPALQNVDGSGVYVVSYLEGRSVVPERILKYMRLLMHHEISTNAFSVVVVFDPRPSTWELEKPGMITPRSLPSSPTMSEQFKKRMAKYTLSTLLGARDKLVKLVVAQKKMQMEQQRQLQAQQHQVQVQAQAG